MQESEVYNPPFYRQPRFVGSYMVLSMHIDLHTNQGGRSSLLQELNECYFELLKLYLSPPVFCLPNRCRRLRRLIGTAFSLHALQERWSGELGDIFELVAQSSSDPSSIHIDADLSRRCSILANNINKAMEELNPKLLDAKKGFSPPIAVEHFATICWGLALIFVALSIFYRNAAYLLGGYVSFMMIFSLPYLLTFSWYYFIEFQTRDLSSAFPVVLDAWLDMSCFLTSLGQDGSIYGNKSVVHARVFMDRFESAILNSSAPLEQFTYDLALNHYDTFKDFVVEWEELIHWPV